MQKKIKEILITVLETLLITGVTVFTVLPVSCRINETGIHVLGGDYSPPKLEEVIVFDESTLRLIFSKKVTMSARVFMVGDFNKDSFEVGVDVCYSNCEEQTDTTVDVRFEDQMHVGTDYEIIGTVKDETGNTTTFLVPFVGFNSRVPLMVMTEVQTESVSSQNAAEKAGNFWRNEFVEFLVLSDGNLSGLEFESAYDGIERKFKFPAIEVHKGEIFVLHLRKRGEGCFSESGDDLNLASSSYCSKDVRDLWVITEETALGNKTDVLVLRNSFNGSVIDCLMYRESKLTEWNEKYLGLVEECYKSGIYSSDDDEFISKTDGMTATKTLNRLDAKELLLKVQNGFIFEGPVVMGKDNWNISAANPGTL